MADLQKIIAIKSFFFFFYCVFLGFSSWRSWVREVDFVFCFCFINFMNQFPPTYRFSDSPFRHVWNGKIEHLPIRNNFSSVHVRAIRPIKPGESKLDFIVHVDIVSIVSVHVTPYRKVYNLRFIELSFEIWRRQYLSALNKFISFPFRSSPLLSVRTDSGHHLAFCYKILNYKTFKHWIELCTQPID